jgi:hypothetical protein
MRCAWRRRTGNGKQAMAAQRRGAEKRGDGSGAAAGVTEK